MFKTTKMPAELTITPWINRFFTTEPTAVIHRCFYSTPSHFGCLVLKLVCSSLRLCDVLRFSDWLQFFLRPRNQTSVQKNQCSSQDITVVFHSLKLYEQFQITACEQSSSYFSCLCRSCGWLQLLFWVLSASAGYLQLLSAALYKACVTIRPEEFRNTEASTIATNTLNCCMESLLRP